MSWPRIVMVLIGASYLAANVAVFLAAIWDHNQWLAAWTSVGALFSLLCVKAGVDG